MRRRSGYLAAVGFVLIMFGLSLALESSAWARAGGGGSSGSRGSRSFSSPAMPSRPSPSPSPVTPSRPGVGAPGATPYPSSPGYSRSPFWSGVAGGVAGGLLGSMLFGGHSYASYGMGGFGGSGIGLFELVIIGALIYFGMRFFRRRRAEQNYYYASGEENAPGYGAYPDAGGQAYTPQLDEVSRGFEEIRRSDPYFSEASFKESAEDMFFRIQAAWMNRSLEGVENMVTPDMNAYFIGEFEKMKKFGTVNRLENIAVRKVEPSEVWHESGRDYITVFFTANLLDYTVDELTGQVVQGDKLNPVKFQEFWTFSRDKGGRQWQLSAINQVGEISTH
ncbi:MAG: Tim44 domain-containing protein [Syntrophobacter sp.]